MLHADEGRHAFGDLLHRRRLQVDGRTTGDVVREQRQFERPTDLLEVRDQPTLRRFDEVRSDHEERVGAGVDRVGTEPEGFFEALRAGGGDDGDTARRGLHRDPHQPGAFLGRQCGGCSGGPVDDDPARPRPRLTVDEVGEGRFVERAVAERRDERRERAAEFGVPERDHEDSPRSLRPISARLVRKPGELPSRIGGRLRSSCQSSESMARFSGLSCTVSS